MDRMVSTGWTVVDVKGVEIGTIVAIVPDPADDATAEDEIMVVETALFGAGAQVRVPMTGIRAVMPGRLLLTEPHARFVELGWVERKPTAEQSEPSVLAQAEGHASGSR